MSLYPPDPSLQLVFSHPLFICGPRLLLSLDIEQCEKCSEYKHSTKHKVVRGFILKLSL